MELRQFKTLVTVADNGSLARSSEILGIAQPALSRQIKMLEEELRVILFTRTSRGMKLTEAGETVYLRATNILEQVSKVKADLDVSDEEDTSNCSLVLPPSIADFLSSTITDRFLKKYPKCSFRLVGGMSGYAEKWLDEGEIDVALMYQTHMSSKYYSVSVLSENLYFVQRADKDRVDEPTITWAALEDYSFVLPSPSHNVRNVIEGTARTTNTKLDIAVESDTLGLLKSLVARGELCSILPQAAVMEELKNKTLSMRKIVHPELFLILHIAFLAEKKLSKINNDLIKVVIEEIRKLVQKGDWKAALHDTSKIELQL